MESSLLKKYQDLNYSESTTLFMPDMRDAVVRHICPLCFRKLYEMRDKPLAYCKNRGHKRFIIAKSKLI